MTDHPGPAENDGRPLVVSLIGTFLKPEMRSVYRQVTGLKTFRTVVFTERRSHADAFPFESVVVMNRTAGRTAPRPIASRRVRGSKPLQERPRGNFARRFFYKHLLGIWPPPTKALQDASPVISASSEPAPGRFAAEPPDHYGLLGLLASHRPALLHVYYGHKAVKFLPLIRRWPGPVIVSFHGLDAGDAAYPKFLGGAGEALPPVFEHARLVLARSQSLLDRLAALGCPPEKLRLNRAPIPLEDGPARIVQAPADGGWRLLQACRLIPKKGLVTTLRAFSLVLRYFPAARLTIAGEGPQGEELKTLAEGLGIASSVTFTGWCDPCRLRELFDTAHLFLHPSEQPPGGDREGVPNALLEAMSLGLPVVATHHGGIPEAVTDLVDGRLVPERDPEALAAAILQILGDGNLTSTLSLKASANIRGNFGATEQLARLEGYYLETQEHGPSPGM